MTWWTYKPEQAMRYARIRDRQILDPPGPMQFFVPPFSGHLELAANPTDFLVIASQTASTFPFTAWMLIKPDGKTFSTLLPGASLSPRSATGIDHDFFAVQSITAGDTFRANSQWIITAPEPAFGVSILAGGNAIHRLFQLAPGRRYQIENSPDLTTWSPFTTISDEPGFEFQTPPQKNREFYRAVLIPD
jgi:hypothetical protein